PLVRDLYLLAESVAVDRSLAAELPGLVPELCAARAAALADRPDARVLTPQEHEVEGRLRAALAAHPAHPPPAIPVHPSPAESLRWAEGVAAEVGRLPGRFRGVRAVPLWGRTEPPPPDAPPGLLRPGGEMEDPRLAPERVRTLRRRPRVRQAPEDEDDDAMGMWMIQLDDPQEHAEDPMGLQRPTDRDHDADADDLADSLSELPEARLVPIPGAPTEVLASEDPPGQRAQRQEGVARGYGIAYPEWDWRVGAYHPGRAVVREVSPPLGPAGWAEAILERHARQVQQVRRRFERL